MDSNNTQLRFINDFLMQRGINAEDGSFIPLAGDGSQRTYHRFISTHSDRSFVLMENRPVNELIRKENNAYLMIGKHLYDKGIPVPEILCHDLENGWFILEDMGDTHLNDDNPPGTGYLENYKRVIDVLFRLQTRGAEGFETGWCCQTEYYDHSVMRKLEADYFLEAFLCNYLGLKEEILSLDSTFEYLSKTASKAESGFFLHRDFQARNIMINNGKIRIIDWQGGRLGPPAYDLASLLIEAYRLSDDERQAAYDYYLEILTDHRPDIAENFKKYYPYLAVQRNLQILGAFSFLTRVRKKTQFEVYIRPALNSLKHLLNELADPGLSPLRDTLKSIQNTQLITDNSRLNREETSWMIVYSVKL